MARLKKRDPFETACAATYYDPVQLIATRIRDALDPNQAPGPVRTWAEMTEEEKQRLRERYETMRP